jgi:hypothetical protein
VQLDSRHDLLDGVEPADEPAAGRPGVGIGGQLGADALDRVERGAERVVALLADLPVGSDGEAMSRAAQSGLLFICLRLDPSRAPISS